MGRGGDCGGVLEVMGLVQKRGHQPTKRVHLLTLISIPPLIRTHHQRLKRPPIQRRLRLHPCTTFLLFTPTTIPDHKTNRILPPLTILHKTTPNHRIRRPMRIIRRKHLIPPIVVLIIIG